MASDRPSLAARQRAKDLKHALYDRRPDLCRQPVDDWLNQILSAAAERFGDMGDDTVLLQAIVAFEANEKEADAKLSSTDDAFLRDGYADAKARLREVRDALDAMRAEARAAAPGAP